MHSRFGFVLLIIALCVSVAVAGKDVATDIVSPQSTEPPGLVSVQIKLTNVGDVPAYVETLRVTIVPSGYVYHYENIPIPVDQSVGVTMPPWVCPAHSDETCTAWIAYPADTNHANDTDVVVVNRGVDVATEIVSPRASEEPGLVPVRVKLTNLGDVPALVSAVFARVRPSAYFDYKEDIAFAVGESSVVLLDSWNYAGGSETRTAYIACFTDTNQTNDTDVVVVNASGVSGRAEMEPRAGMSLTLLPSPLAGNVLRVEHNLTRPGPASVTLFDVSGRVAFICDFIGTRAGELAFDLHSLGAGVYLVRLEDGHQNVARRLVVRR